MGLQSLIVNNLARTSQDVTGGISGQCCACRRRLDERLLIRLKYQGQCIIDLLSPSRKESWAKQVGNQAIAEYCTLLLRGTFCELPCPVMSRNLCEAPHS